MTRIVENVIAGADAGRYPGGNQYPNSADFEAQFVDAAAGDYRIARRDHSSAGGARRAAAGADISRLPAP